MGYRLINAVHGSEISVINISTVHGSKIHTLNLPLLTYLFNKIMFCTFQAPDRQCVTAPCGDRSGSYIHLKTNVTNTKQLLTHVSHFLHMQLSHFNVSYISLTSLPLHITYSLNLKLCFDVHSCIYLLNSKKM